MCKILKYSSILILVLFLGQIIERAIPHSHHEEAGIVIADFSGDMDTSDHEDENSEKLHSTFYQLTSVDLVLVCQYCIQLFADKEILAESIFKIYHSDYNILPKILSSILFIIHICSSKAPPFFN